MTSDATELRRIALAVRKILEEVHQKDPTFRNFPRGSCGVTAELLGRYFIEAYQLEARYVAAQLPGGGSHAWLTIDGIIVDITADQFGMDAVFVALQSDWHDRLEQDLPREPILSPSQWGAYPHSVWHAIVDGMKTCGFHSPED